MVFRIQDGNVNGVDLAGITVIYVGDIPHPSFEELMKDGSECGIYISDDVSPEQREVLDSLAASSIGGLLMKKNFGVKYVHIDVEREGDSVHFKMPAGEMKQQLTTGIDSDPVRLENQVLPFLKNAKACHTAFWNYSDYGRHFSYKDRCGVWADFQFEGAQRIEQATKMGFPDYRGDAR
jgi:hypothetical protein